MKAFLNISRFIVGILFIFSGLVKANDPLGLSYKMQEFFEVWNLHGLNSFTLAFSVMMIAFEIIAGVAVLLGWGMRFFSWMLLLLIIFFTFLTGYALFSGKIKECGCFGDCIPLKANQSFIKDLILLALIIPIFIFRNKILPLFDSKPSMLILFFTAVFSFSFQWYTLTHLPVVDCLPYKIGSNIPEKMKIPEGAIPDSTVITFRYEYKGQKIEFTADEFPEDFNDEEYTYIDRYDKVVRKGNAVPPIKDFSLITPSGNDTTQILLSENQYQLYLFALNEVKTGSFTQYLNTALNLAASKNIPAFLVTNAVIDERITESIHSHLFPLRCDAVAIKTAARANPTLYLIKNGNIEGKWSYADLDRAIKEIQNISN